jgi:hypothetical protein
LVERKRSKFPTVPGGDLRGRKKKPMKVIGSHVTEEGVAIALFFIEDRHLGQAVGAYDGPEDIASNTGFTPFSFPVFFP